MNQLEKHLEKHEISDDRTGAVDLRGSAKYICKSIEHFLFQTPEGQKYLEDNAKKTEDRGSVAANPKSKRLIKAVKRTVKQYGKVLKDLSKE